MFKLFKHHKEKDAEGFEAYRKGFFDAFGSGGRWFDQNYYEGLKYKASRRDYEDGQHYYEETKCRAQERRYF